MAHLKEGISGRRGGGRGRGAWVLVALIILILLLMGGVTDAVTVASSCNKELATSDPKAYWECFQTNNWGIENIGIDKLHDRGLYGSGKIVAVIDIDFDTSHPIYNYIGDGSGGIDLTRWKDWKLNVIEVIDYTYLPDMTRHGTEVAGVVWEIAPKAKFIIIKANLNEDRIKGIRDATSVEIPN